MSKIFKKEYTYQNFLDEFNSSFHNKPVGLRNGQYLMNFLHSKRPDLYTRITNSENDCYYDDRIIGNTTNFLKDNW
jgi:hypothetical protein